MTEDHLLECVVNVAEGRRADVLAELAAACGAALLDLHADADHHRSVFTLAGEPETLLRHLMNLADAVRQWVDVSDHVGVHPRLGALDVVPFVALGATPPPVAADTARAFAARLDAELSVPVFLYGAADPAGRTLPDIRRHAFTDRAPDFGPPVPHPTMGATSVGARPVLIALNCDLTSGDRELARAVARGVRERDGGLKGIRALGFALESRHRAQVSMNLVDLSATGVEAACREVRHRARALGAEVGAVELVGLMPEDELARCSDAFLAWSGLGPDSTIEARLRAAGLRPPGAGTSPGG